MSDVAEYYANKVAVVTGGASGIGLALGEAMLSHGAACVMLADFDDAELHKQTKRLGGSFPGKVFGVHCDVTQEADVQRMIHKAADFGGGRIDLLFNNAGRGLRGYFDDLSNEDWQKAFAINFYGPLYGIRAVLPLMRKQGSGHIVDIISGIAFWPMAEQSMYTATKAALNALTLALRYEYWDENIRFSSATPGTVVTQIWKKGGTTPPAGAQSPEDSARQVLVGVARNERIVLGDRTDADGAKTCFNPDYADGNDAYLLDVARRRRKGELAL